MSMPAGVPFCWQRRYGAGVRLTEAEYRTLVEHSPMLIWRAGRDAKCDYFNDRWLAFTGRALGAELGDGWAAGVHPDDLPRCLACYLEHFEQREPFEMEYRLRRHDGEYRFILDSGAPFLDRDGEFAGFIGHCVDVHERVRAHQEREERHGQELAVAQEFERWVLGIVGHDIRNPLGSVELAAQLLRGPNLPQETLRALADRIERGVDRIRHIVDDLLDVTRAREGGIPIARQDVELGGVCRQVVDELATRTQCCPIDVRCECEVHGTWDPHRIAQAVSNLVGNALQHGLAGPVTVEVTTDGREAAVEVHNEGEVPGDVVGSLFVPFRTRPEGRAHGSGLGLGLFISRAIALAHGGAVELASVPGAGTTATLRLPLAGVCG
jgi:PAS domain S-box-containing protein